MMTSEPVTIKPNGAGRFGGNNAVLSFHAVSRSFKLGRRRSRALHEISLELKPGKITGLIGPDGSGKTTLMRMAAGLLPPDSGQVEVLGRDVVRDALSIQAAVGYMPQRFGLYEDLTVRENLDLYADLQGVAPEQRPGRYRDLMRMTGLEPFSGRRAGRLSGGMKQKLGLACTLLRPPQLLLLDEPTVGVDPVSRRELWQIVDRFVYQEGTTVLLSTAYLDEAERCNEVIILSEGRLIGNGPPEAFSAPLAGRTFRIRAPGMNHRHLQEQLSATTGVTDAVIQGDAVRLVMAPHTTAAMENLLPGIDGAEIRTVAPRFEDGFVAMLGKGRPKPTQRSSAANASLALRGDAGNKSDGLIIEVRGVQRRFGDFYAVRGVSFNVRAGEVFGLLGANGAGKTTTFRMLCGLLPASAGSLHIAGIDVRRTAAAARAKIGYMSQKFSLYGNLSVGQNLHFFSSAYGLRGHRRTTRIQWAVEQFELAPVLEATSSTLPLGYKQRLALACALMHEPEILFLDEPTSGVDPLARREFWHRINALADQNVTVMVTTHFMEEAEYCDRMAIMVAGEILALGSPFEIKAQARSKEKSTPTMEDAFIHVIQSQEAQRTP
jgi:ABC-2 type transport system ATP-binding protein